jgi:hypothetical protein
MPLVRRQFEVPLGFGLVPSHSVSVPQVLRQAILAGGIPLVSGQPKLPDSLHGVLGDAKAVVVANPCIEFMRNINKALKRNVCTAAPQTPDVPL